MSGVPQSKPWHDECRRLRAEGLSQPEIAARLKVARIDLRFVLNESEEQKKALKRARERSKPRIRPERKKQWAPKLRAAAPGAITPEMKRVAILAFASGQIDRFELMRQITPRGKWRGVSVE